LASCRAFTRVRLTFGKGLFEHANYFSTGKVCGVTTAGEGLTIEFPAQNTKIIGEVKQLIGDSTYQSSDFEESFSTAQALVVGAALDIVRREMLDGLAKNQEDINPEFTKEEILKELAAPDSNAQWFATVIKGIISQPRQEELMQSIEDLSSAGYLIRSGEIYRLHSILELLASRFLIVDKILSLRTGEEIEREVFQSGFVCMQSGVNDLLMLDTDGEKLYLEAVSAQKVIDYLQFFLTQPKSLVKANNGKRQEEQVLASASQGSHAGGTTKEASITCPYCRTGLPAGAKFCTSCGRQLGIQPSFCKSCGSRLVANAKFCGNCGHPVTVGD